MEREGLKSNSSAWLFFLKRIYFIAEKSKSCVTQLRQLLSCHLSGDTERPSDGGRNFFACAKCLREWWKNGEKEVHVKAKRGNQFTFKKRVMHYLFSKTHSFYVKYFTTKMIMFEIGSQHLIWHFLATSSKMTIVSTHTCLKRPIGIVKECQHAKTIRSFLHFHRVKIFFAVTFFQRISEGRMFNQDPFPSLYGKRNIR